MANRKLQLDKKQRQTLLECGATTAQVEALEFVLPLIRKDIAGRAPLTDVREVLKSVHDALSQAERDVNRMLIRASQARVTAYGYLASGAASIELPDAVAGIESATEGTVPEIVDVPTLLRLLVLAAERGRAEVPAGQVRKTAPTRAIWRIVEALNRPYDALSRKAADRLKPGRSRDAFLRLSECVFEAAGCSPGVSVDRAIRTFLDTYTFARGSRRWYPIPPSSD